MGGQVQPAKVVRVQALWRGRAPNCSSAGSVVGAALLTMGGVAVALNLLARRLVADRGAGLRLRTEGEGAVVYLPESGDKAFVDAAGVAALPAATRVGGGAAVAGALTAPTEVHVALTGRCPLPCTGCYLGAAPDGEAGGAELGPFFAALGAMGVFEVALGGGERRFDAVLFAAIDAARAAGLGVNLTTSGLGLDEAVAARLVGKVGQVNISLDGLGPVYRAVRGFDGAAMAFAAIGHLRAAGIPVGVNTVLSRPLLGEDGALDALGASLREAGVAEWQWLRFKPSGRGVAAWGQLAPPAEALDGLLARLLAAEAATGLRMRVDCALLPFVLADLEPDQAAAMGLRGCPGGHSLLARSADGSLSPCSFVAGSAPGAAPEAVWAADPTLQAWRGRAVAPPEPCASCPHRDLCRGGCHAVAAVLVGDPLAPDPQCPRVRAYGR